MGWCAKGNGNADSDANALFGRTLSSDEELVEEYFERLSDDDVDEDDEDEPSPE